MRYTLLSLLIILQGCVGTDLVDFPIGEDLTDLSFQEQEVILEVGDTYQTTISYILADGTPGMEALMYASDNGAVAEVSSSGLITAIGSGQTIIRVVAMDIDREAEIYSYPWLKMMTRSPSRSLLPPMLYK